MLLVAPVREERRVPIDPEQLRTMEDDPDLRRRVNVVRSDDPGRHPRRLQRPAPDRRRATRNPRFHRPARGLRPATGCPVLVNTSFNVRGEPIVCTPEDAYRCFLATDMDVLVLEDIVLVKDDGGPRRPATAAREEYLAQFQLD